MSTIRNFFKIRRRIKQRGTINSLLVVLMLFGFFLEAYMHNFNLVYITLFFVFATAFSVSPFGILNLGQLKAHYSHSERLFSGVEGYLFFKISNSSLRPAWAIELHCDKEQTKVSKIEGHSHKIIELQTRRDNRGKYSIDKCRLESLFPLSTVRFVLPFNSSHEIIVYPKPRGKSLQSLLAKQRAYFGEEMDFDGLSPYSGESLSRIHWASVAKGEMSVKKFSHEMQSRELKFGFYDAGTDDEMRLSQLTLWVLECERLREPFQIIMPHKVLRSKEEDIDAILEYLAIY